MSGRFKDYWAPVLSLATNGSCLALAITQDHPPILQALDVFACLMSLGWFKRVHQQRLMQNRNAIIEAFE